jgi:hypothetical protein
MKAQQTSRIGAVWTEAIRLAGLAGEPAHNTKRNMKTKHIRSLAGNLAGIVLSMAVLPLAALGQANYATPYTFTTLAGNTGNGSADGTNSAARFAYPWGAAVDTNGNVYVADTVNNTIRKVTPAGMVTTLAGLAGSFGSADGTNSAARFNDPVGVAVDSAGNLYVGDTGNNTIRQVTPVRTNWVVTTLAGLAGSSGSANGTNSAARFYHPYGVAVDSATNVYVADAYNDTIRKVTPVGTNWVVTTLAGQAGVTGSNDGGGTSAQFDSPTGVAVDTNGNVYVVDFGNDTIRKVRPVGGNWDVTTLAGLAGSFGSADGTNSAARFNNPYGVAVDSATNVYVADWGNDTIRKVTPVGTSWVVTTLAGLAGSLGSADGTNSAARFNDPSAVAVDSAGNLYAADTGNSTIREVTPLGANWRVTTLAGLATGGPGSADGTGSAARFHEPLGAAVDSAGNLYVGDYANDTIRKVTPAGVVTTLAGLAGSSGSADGTNSAARFDYPSGVAVDSATNVYVADWANHTIRKVTPVGTNWVVTTLAGKAGIPGLVNGTGTNAEFDYPNNVAVDTNGNVYVADTANGAIRKVTPAGVVTTLSEDFSGPTGVAVDGATNVYVADYYSHTIRKVTPAGVVTILAGFTGTSGTADGTNTAARFNYPWGVALDSATNVYVTDSINDTIRMVRPVGTHWVVTTLAGLAGSFGGADGTGSAAQFNSPFGVAVDSAGNVYVADVYNSTIRKGFPASSVPAPNLEPPSLSAGQFGFGITGLPNLAVNIESSADLSSWQLVGTSILEGGTNFFVSPAQTQGAQFYRGHVR